MTPIALTLLFSFLTIASEGSLPDSPAGEVYDLALDRNLVKPRWKEPWTGPDIPLSFGFQESTNHPEQIILTPAVRDASHVFVTWLTPKPTDEVIGTVNYGIAPDSLTRQSRCNSHNYSYALGKDASYVSGPIFHCQLGPLEPSTRFFYRVNGSQLLFNFTSLPRPGSKPEGQPFRFALMADVGQTVNSSITLDHAAAADVDLVLFVGDLTYADSYKRPNCKPFQGLGSDLGFDTCGEGGVRWDSWGRLAQKIFSHTPVAFCPGNHENEMNPSWGEHEPFKAFLARVPALLDNHLDYGTFAKYIDRNSLPTAGYPPKSPLFYSIDVGLAHVIALSSYSAFTTYTHQDYFLRDDLCGIDRSVTPWLFVFAHAPWYNSDSSHYLEGEPFRVMFEPYLYNSTVDLVIAGHVHAYERSHPVYNLRINQCGPVYVTVGDGGNDEGVAGPFLEPQPVYSAYREESFGYAELEIVSEREAKYTWYRNQNSEPIPGDSFQLENKHFKCGPKKPTFCRNGLN